MNTAWLIYLLAASAVWLVAVYGLYKVLPLVHTLLLGLLLLVLLLTPVAVPETSSVAPAWLAAVYELAFGQPVLAERAFRPLAWSLSLALIPLAGFIVWRLFQEGSTKLRSDGE